MANVCWNKLTVLGEDVATFVTKAEGLETSYTQSEQEKKMYLLVYGKEEPFSTQNRVLCFHRLHPVPKEVLAAGYNAAGKDWQEEQWGCKWEPELSQRIVSPREALYEFETANDPPCPLLERVAADFPDLTFFLSYGVEDPGRGRAVWVHGRLHEHLHGERHMGPSDGKSWMTHYVETHDAWVKEMLAAVSVNGW